MVTLGEMTIGSLDTKEMDCNFKIRLMQYMSYYVAVSDCLKDFQYEIISKL